MKKELFGGDKLRFEAQLKRDLADYLLTHLDAFQQYDIIKVYYDNGQQIVSNALHAAIDYALSKTQSSTDNPLRKTIDLNRLRIFCAR